MQDRRIGKFTISRHIVDECPDVARAVLRDVLIVRAEAMWHMDRIEYVGAHPAFAAKPDGEMPPEYMPEIKARGDGSVESVKWTLLKP